MLFSSISFLYVFLPIVCFIYFVVPKKLRNLTLLIASLFFYIYGEPVYTLLLVFSSLSDFIHAKFIYKYADTKKSKYLLISSLIINLGMLGFFKYIDFIIISINNIFNLNVEVLSIPLPIGISFFTFQTMSYSIDVYMKRVKPQRSLVNMGTFVCLFPQLIAGPIVRYTDIEKELDNRSVRLDMISNGIKRFAIGLGKKVMIANLMGEFCAMFRLVEGKSVVFYWLYAIAFSLQIFFDFAGYSDMAIGLGSIFGFKFPENFNYPFIASSITDFWRRWHMTLSSWFKDYVYIPLGGNRVSKVKWYRNIFIVWFLTGLWHGAALNFIIWGLFFGLILVLEKLFILNLLQKVKPLFRHLYVILIVLISFVIFNASTMTQLMNDLRSMFMFNNLPFITVETIYYFKSYIVILLVALILSTPIVPIITNKIKNSKYQNITLLIEPIFIALVLIVTTASLIDGSFNPFLYFRF